MTDGDARDPDGAVDRLNDGDVDVDALARCNTTAGTLEGAPSNCAGAISTSQKGTEICAG